MKRRIKDNEQWIDNAFSLLKELYPQVADSDIDYFVAFFWDENNTDECNVEVFEKWLTTKEPVSDSYEMNDSVYGNNYSIYFSSRRNKEEEFYLVEEGQLPSGVDFLEFLESEYNLVWRKSDGNHCISEISNNNPIVYFMAELS